MQLTLNVVRTSDGAKLNKMVETCAQLLQVVPCKMLCTAIVREIKTNLLFSVLNLKQPGLASSLDSDIMVVKSCVVLLHAVGRHRLQLLSKPKEKGRARRFEN